MRQSTSPHTKVWPDGLSRKDETMGDALRWWFAWAGFR